MVTYNQLLKYPRIVKVKKIFKPILQKCPQKKGVCMRLFFLKPKKPNSARRRMAKIHLLVNKRKGFFGYIPGNIHTLQEYGHVLVRGGRVRDLPGVRYKIIRGVLDCQAIHFRRNGRSKYGAKWWWRIPKDAKLIRDNKKKEKLELVAQQILHTRTLRINLLKFHLKKNFKIKYDISNLKFLKEKKVIFNTYLYSLSSKKKIKTIFFSTSEKKIKK